MNEEIKEIIDKLEIVARKHTYEVLDDGNIETMPASVVDELRLNNYSAKTLLNYITNLQEENIKLKETNEEHRKINGQLQEENNMLKKELKNKPDCEWTLETKDGQIMTIIQSERIDMQEKLNKSNQKLFKENQKLVKVIEELENYLKVGIAMNYNMNNDKLSEQTVDNYTDILNKLTELKGGSNEK